MDVSMKGGVSVVSREECDTTRGGNYSLGKLSLERKKSCQSMFVVLFEKKLLQLRRDQQQYLCSLSTHAPQIGAISIRVTSSSAVRDRKFWLFRRVLTKIVTHHHHQLSIESMGMRCRTLIFRKAPHPQATANYRRSLLIAST